MFFPGLYANFTMVFVIYLRWNWDDILIILVASGALSNYYIGHTFIYQIHFAFFSLNLTRNQFKWSVWIYTVPSFTCPDIVHNQITFRWKDLLLLFWYWCWWWDAPGTDLELKASISFPSTHNYFCLLLYIHMFLYWDFWIDDISKMDFYVLTYAIFTPLLRKIF